MHEREKAPSSVGRPRGHDQYIEVTFRSLTAHAGIAVLRDEDVVFVKVEGWVERPAKALHGAALRGTLRGAVGVMRRRAVMQDGGGGANMRWRGVEPEAQEECGAGNEGKDPVGEACSH